MVSRFMPLIDGRIDHGHAVRFAEGPERVHVVAARKLEGGQIEPREPSIKFNQSLYKLRLEHHLEHQKEQPEQRSFKFGLRLFFLEKKPRKNSLSYPPPNYFPLATSTP